MDELVGLLCVAGTLGLVALIFLAATISRTLTHRSVQQLSQASSLVLESSYPIRRTVTITQSAKIAKLCSFLDEGSRDRTSHTFPILILTFRFRDTGEPYRLQINKSGWTRFSHKFIFGSYLKFTDDHAFWDYVESLFN